MTDIDRDLVGVVSSVKNRDQVEWGSAHAGIETQEPILMTIYVSRSHNGCRGERLLDQLLTSCLGSEFTNDSEKEMNIRRPLPGGSERERKSWR